MPSSVLSTVHFIGKYKYHLKSDGFETINFKNFGHLNKSFTFVSNFCEQFSVDFDTCIEQNDTDTAIKIMENFVSMISQCASNKFHFNF